MTRRPCADSDPGTCAWQGRLWAGRLAVGLLAIVAVAAPGGPARPPAVAAQGGAPVALLVGAIPEAQAAPVARGVFYQGGGAFELPAQVLLAATPDGRGELCTDDRAQLDFIAADGRRQRWSHSFAGGERRAIVCLAPQLIVLAAGAGSYRVELRLDDQHAHTYSSRPYYLLAAGPRVPVEGAAPPTAPAAAPTAAPAGAPTAPSTAPAAAPVASPTSQPAALSSAPTMAQVPAASAVGQSTAGPPAPAGIGGEAPATPGPAPTPEPSSTPWPAMARALWCTLGAALVTLVGAALLLRRRVARGRPRRGAMAGIIDLRDRETGEARTLLLHQFPQGVAIGRRPLTAAPWAGEQGATIAAILPAAGAPLLHDLSGDGAETVPLADGDAIVVGGVVEVRYRR